MLLQVIFPHPAQPLLVGYLSLVDLIDLKPGAVENPRLFPRFNIVAFAILSPGLKPRTINRARPRSGFKPITMFRLLHLNALLVRKGIL
jgi:hypothetical protein